MRLFVDSSNPRPQDRRERLHVYCDESGTTERYMAYGGVITTEPNVTVFNEIMEAWRVKTGMHAELKWEKVSRKKLPEYKQFVNTFFDHAERNAMHFCVMVCDTKRIDYKRYHRNDKILGFYRFYRKFLPSGFCPMR